LDVDDVVAAQSPGGASERAGRSIPLADVALGHDESWVVCGSLGEDASVTADAAAFPADVEVADAQTCAGQPWAGLRHRRGHASEEWTGGGRSE
jgi:hypothetical protein